MDVNGMNRINTKRECAIQFWHTLYSRGIRDVLEIEGYTSHECGVGHGITEIELVTLP